LWQINCYCKFLTEVPPTGEGCARKKQRLRHARRSPPEDEGGLRFKSDKIKMKQPEFNIKAAKNNLDKKIALNKTRLDLKYKKANKDFSAISKMIIKKYNPDRIYQWGSLLNRNHFSEISDIDIAIEGIASAETFFAISADAEKLTTFPLDIIQIEKVHPLHAESIRKKGKLIYEAKRSDT
jgi:predicted nucleotidyltransferase